MERIKSWRDLDELVPARKEFIELVKFIVFCENEFMFEEFDFTDEEVDNILEIVMDCIETNDFSTPVGFGHALWEVLDDYVDIEDVKYKDIFGNEEKIKQIITDAWRNGDY